MVVNTGDTLKGDLNLFEETRGMANLFGKGLVEFRTGRIHCSFDCLLSGRSKVRMHRIHRNRMRTKSLRGYHCC